MKILSVLLVVLGSFVAISGKKCPPNQKYLTCGGCDQVCNKGPISCAAVCGPPGCYCLQGYYRESPSNQSACVSSSNCPGPRAQDQSSSSIQNTAPPKCPVNEVYKECGSCEQYCNEGPIACTAVCRDPGCYCRDGYVRSFRGGVCIPPKSCPRAQDQSSSSIQDTGPQISDQSLPYPYDKVLPPCRKNEEYSYCGRCDQYCNEEPIFCTADCKNPGCYCKDGFVRESRGEGSACIPPDSCPSLPQNPEYHCGDNEVFNYCGVGWECEDYCGRGANACAYCEPGCYCKPGYVRDGPEYEAVCIPDDQCPSAQDTSLDFSDDAAYQCGDNEVFNYCGVGWECEDYCGRGANACAYCEPGCYCKPGYVRDGPEYEAVCIPENQCPRAPVEISSAVQDAFIQCGANEVFNRCGVGKGCENYCGRGPNACAYCQPGCYCRSGYIRDGPESNAVCIPEDKCPRALVAISSVPQDTGPPASAVVSSFVDDAAIACGANEVYDRCGVGKGCEDYCGRGANACAYCQPGCYCRPGYIRDGPESNAVCIPQDKCIACGANEVYDGCGVGKGCEDYCGRGANACAYCQPGCYCKRGYIRDGPESNAVCIPRDRCPSAQFESSFFSEGAGYKCRPNEVFNQCGVGPECEDYCGKGPVACAYCKPGCYCIDGYIRAGPSNRTRCVPRNQCSVAQKCLQNEVYNECGTACPDSCDGRNRICTTNCVAGCFCKQGFIRLHDDTQTTRYKCIPQDQCAVS